MTDDTVTSIDGHFTPLHSTLDRLGRYGTPLHSRLHFPVPYSVSIDDSQPIFVVAQRQGPQHGQFQVYMEFHLHQDYLHLSNG